MLTYLQINDLLGAIKTTPAPQMSDLIICKHNELIENFIFNATELELQILNYAVATTNPYWDNNNLVYKISIPELVGIYKAKSKNIHKVYRVALLRLMKRTYVFYDQKNKRHIENLITRVTEDMTDNSYLEFRFNEYISKRISNLKGLFTSYDIKQIARFKTKYAFILYEFFKLGLDRVKFYENDTYKKKISVENFRINLSLEEKYSAFKDLEKYVLKVAQANINNHSDITMSYKVHRKGRTPTDITFTAKFKTKAKKKEAVEIQEKLELEAAPEPKETKLVELTDEQRQERKSQLKNMKKEVKKKSKS